MSMERGKRVGARRAGRPVLRDAPEMIAYFREEIAEGRIPTFSGAAERLGYTCGMLMQACREREAFAAAYAECRMLLVDYLIEGGLTKRLDGTLVKLMLAELGHAEVGGLGVYGCGEGASESEGGVEITVRVEAAQGDF